MLAAYKIRAGKRTAAEGLRLKADAHDRFICSACGLKVPNDDYHQVVDYYRDHYSTLSKICRKNNSHQNLVGFFKKSDT